MSATAFRIVALALLGGGCIAAATDSTCKFTIQDMDSTKEPLVLDVKQQEIRGRRAVARRREMAAKDLVKETVEQLEIARPDPVYDPTDKKYKGVVSVKDGKRLLFACPGKSNYDQGTNEQTAYVTCQGGQLMYGRNKAQRRDFTCSKQYAESWLKVTEDTCGSGDDTGTIFQLGFNLDDGSFFDFVDICHNVTLGATLYSYHALYGHSLKGAVKSSERRKFSRGPKPLYEDVNPDSVYVRRGQEKAFDIILGNSGHDLYINNTSFLARGHLSPDADFIYNSGQLMTYYYVNAAPQWQMFNAGNWLAIENAVRDLASKEDETIGVYTGTYGVLKLANADGAERQIYLEAKKKLIPAPEVYWKLVMHPVTKSCTVAVGHNNPFLTSPPTPICEPETPSGWPTLDNLKKGYTYYCDYASFKKAVDFVPTLDCKDLFIFPEKDE